MRAVIAIIIISGFVFLVVNANAEVPRHVAYQGMLKDADGTLLVGPVDLIVRFYGDAESEENLLFEEEHKAIPLTNGVYSIQIGQGVVPDTEDPSGGIPDGVFTVSNLWLTETVDGGDELAPRLNIGSTIFALKSKFAEGLGNPQAGQASVLVNSSGNVGIGTETPSEKLQVDGNIEISSGGQLRFSGGASPDLYSAASTNLQLGANGSQTHMTIDVDGNIGIGTATPNAKLDVEGGIFITGSNPELGLSSEGNMHITAGYDFGGNEEIVFNTVNDDGSDVEERMRIAEDGNVGIGTPTPGAILHIVGTNGKIIVDSADSDFANITLRNRGSNRVQILTTKDSALLFAGSSAGSTQDWMSITNDGNVGIGTITPTEALDVLGTVKATRFIGDGSGLSGLGDDHSLDAVDGDPQDVVFVDNGGNVGIGTTAPEALLDVASNSSSSRIQLDPSLATSGYTARISIDNTGMKIGHNSGSRDMQFQTNSVTRMSIDTIGRVGIGLTQPKRSLQVQGTDILLKNDDPGSSVHLRTDIFGASFINNMDGFVDNESTGNQELTLTGQAGIRFHYGNSGSSGTEAMRIDPDGVIRCTGGGIVCGSDRRWKKNIKSINDGLEKVKELRGVKYDWRTVEFPEKNFEEGQQIGFIAQEVEKVIPEVVRTDDEGYKSLDYARLTAVLVEAIKELKAEKDEEVTALRVENENQILALRAEKNEEIGTLKAEISELKSSVSEINELRAQLSALQEQLSLNP